MALKTSSRELSKNEKILLGVLCIIAIAFLINAFIIDPSNTKLKPLKEEISLLQKQKTQLKTINLDIEKNEEELDALKEEYNKASETISKTDRYPQIIRDIGEMANKSNIKIESQSFTKPALFTDEQEKDGNSQEKDQSTNVVSTEGLASFNVDLNVKGSFANLMNFIGKLEEDSRILEIEKFNSNDLGANIELVYYIAGGQEQEEYDFNSGNYGKGNIFK